MHAAVWLLWEEGNECGRKAKGVHLKLKGEVTDRNQSGGGGGGGGGGERGGGGGGREMLQRQKKKEADKHHTNVERAADWSLRLTVVDIMAGMESEGSGGGGGGGWGGGCRGVISHNKHPLATTTKIL